MTIKAVWGIYIILGGLGVSDNVKLNTNIPPFLNLTSCVTFVEENKETILNSATSAFGKYQIREMGCVEVMKKEFTPIFNFDLTS